MSFSGSIKRNLFWFFDFIKGSPIRKQYLDIKLILKYGGYRSERQLYHLTKLINYATKNSPFYRDQNEKKIEDFPVLNKIILRQNYDSIKVEDDKIPFQKGKIHIQRTSGSTGTPLAVPQDTRKRNRRIAELKYFGEIAGFKSHEKMAQLRIWTRWQNKSNFQIFKENIYPVDCSKINDDLFNNLCNLINREKITALLGYASWFTPFIDFVITNKIKIDSLNVVIAGSEMLQSDTRINLQKELNCNVVSRYSNEEQGILGQEKINSEYFYLNHASYYFEFLKVNSDEKALPGEIARIVVTDLFNYAFPLIRYDTGDTCIFDSKINEGSYNIFIKKIYGRLIDLVFDENDNPIHPMTLARIVKNYDAIETWQFIQKDKADYKLLIKKNKALNENDIISEMKQIFGQNTAISIEYVNEIPLLPSGKRKPVLNEWKR